MSVRASEAILHAIRAQGGKIPAWQFQEWLAELAKRRYIKYDITDSGDVVIKLTERADEWFKARELNRK